MSLILEALKKSEAKRRLGSAPDLGTPFAARRRRSPIVPIIVAILIVGGLAWWWTQRTPSPAPPKSDVAQVAPPPRASVALKSVTGNNSLQPTPPPSNLAKAPPSGAADPFTPVMGNDANGARQAMKDQRERRRQNPRDRGDNPGLNGQVAQGTLPNIPPGGLMNRPNSNNGAPPPPNAVAANTPRPAGRVSIAPPAVVPSPTPVEAPAPTQPAAVTAQKTASSTPPVDVATRAPKTPGTVGLPVTPPSTEQSTAAKQAPSLSAQPYSELPFSFRKSLPELRLSMHVYMADPARRFVILNDSRITEGDKTNDDVYVREIRPDGAVLEFQGQRFFYPRDGL